MATVVVPKSCKLALTSGMNAIKLHKDEQIKPKKIRQRTNLIKKKKCTSEISDVHEEGALPLAVRCLYKSRWSKREQLNLTFFVSTQVEKKE